MAPTDETNSGPLADRKSVGVTLGVFIALAGLYACTAYGTIGPGDSGEYTVAMISWGVPHAPGYPLLCLLGNVVARLADRTSAAGALNLLNAGFAAAAAALVMLAVVVLTRRWWAGVT